jgi:chitinase
MRPFHPLRHLYLPAAVLALCSLSAAARAPFPVIGYWANWNGGIDRIQYPHLTHINYSFGRTNAGGTITGVDETQIRDLVARAHAAGTKVGLAIGGWGTHQDFISMTASPASIDNFIKNAVALCEKHQLDGIDMDWEYPTASTADVFASLMKSLGEALHAKGKYLSTAVISDGDGTGKHIHSAVFGYVDYLNIMAYDGGGQNHSSYELATLSLNYWVKQRGCPRAKAILGVPFYGKSPATAYGDIIDQDPTAAQRDNLGSIYFNGIPTMQKKTQLAYEQGGGIMIWEIGQDTHDQHSLLKAIADKAKGFSGSSTRPGSLQASSPLLSVSAGRIRFNAPAAGRYIMTIRSLSGELMRESPLTVYGAGETSIPWEAAGLGAGMYSATVQGERHALSRWFVLSDS